MRKQAEQYKTEMLRNLQDSGRKSKPTEVLEAEKVIAKYRETEEKEREQTARAKLPLPADDACPYCFVERGVTSHMHTIPAEQAAPDVDLFKCRDCGIIIEVNP